MTNPSDFSKISEWIDLEEALGECCEVGANVIVYGKVNRFRGVVECVSANCKQVKIKYDPDESGYPDTHSVETCDIEELRCVLCCDVTWIQINSCLEPDLTTLPSSPPDGQVYLYSGNFNDPDCVLIYQGFGPFRDISSYAKIPNNNVIGIAIEDYILTVSMKDGTEYTAELARNSLASICFDGLGLDTENLIPMP